MLIPMPSSEKVTSASDLDQAIDQVKRSSMSSETNEQGELSFCARGPELETGQAVKEKAAGTIQRNYRGHRTRRELQGLGLDASTRWTELVRDAQYRKLTTPSAPSRTEAGDELELSDGLESRKSSPTAQKQWQRIGTIARRAGGDDQSTTSLDDHSFSSCSSDNGSNQISLEERRKRRQKDVESRNSRRQSAKMMDLQYFLEMVDRRHRHGSNLRKYHNFWKAQPTSQNFFYWLDQGEGRAVSLPQCERARLDREQVRYLSREERLNYLVVVDNQGGLRWAKNGERVWTKDTLYKDSMKGIVPIEDQGPKFHHNVRPDDSPYKMESDSTSSSSDEENKDEKDADGRYTNEDFHDGSGAAKLKEVNPGVIFDHLVRGHMKKGHKWIFVADTSFRLYVGIKQSGAFQHSSFLHGARVSAAGLIKIKDGQLRSLAPLSGHYRPPAANLKSFIHSLQDEGVDMSRVSISKSYAVLVGMESYTRTKRKMKDIESRLEHDKDKILHPEKVKQQNELQEDKSQSAEKERQYLERLRIEYEQKRQGKNEESLSSKVARKLKLRGKGDNGRERVESKSRDVPGLAPGLAPEDGVAST